MVFENAEGSVDTLCAEVSNSFDISEQLRDSSYIKESYEAVLSCHKGWSYGYRRFSGPVYNILPPI